MLSFIWYGNDASTKKEELLVQLALTYGLYGC
jgi:hypothetical protein